MIAAVTGYGSDADREKAAAAGFSHFLPKPVSSDALREVLA